MDTMTPPTGAPVPPPPMNHKQLKAAAKAARPWYLKKRFWALGLVAVIVVGGVASSSSSSKTDSKQNGGVQTVSNNGENPPQADVSITSCDLDQYLSYPQATLHITNHSTKTSDYMIEVNFLDASGTKIADGTAISNNIEAGQSAIEKATGLSSMKGAITCKVTDVNRFASH